MKDSIPQQAELAVSAMAPNREIALQKGLEIRILSSYAERPCSMWLGVCKLGQVNPSQLLEVEDIQRIFEICAQDGISEEGPLMLSDSLSVPPRYTYLLPWSGERQLADDGATEAWIGRLVGVVASWKAPEVGIYFAPQLVSEVHLHRLLYGLIHGLIEDSVARVFNLLMGAHGYNILLNTALTIKQAMRSSGRELLVYH